MDLFHAITQEIENVLSCHWLSEFRDSSRNNSNSNNSSNNSRSTSANPSPGVSRSTSPAPSPLRRSISRNNSFGSGTTSRRSSSTSLSSDELEKSGSRKMSDKLMDTERGGEQTQYESIQTVTKPHSKESGQLGENESGTTTQKPGVDADRAQQTAENIRYGQNISESGVGGFTGTTEGTANQEGGYGGTKAQEELEGNVSGNAGGRTEQGYSAKDGKHDYNVGA